MQLSRLGQGLAVSAVSALVITGLGVTVPANAADGAGVRLLSVQDGIASVRLDADAPFGGTVTLTAERLDPSATIRFEYNTDPAAGNDSAGWTQVDGGSSTQLGAYVTTEWNASSVDGSTVAVRAVATVAATDTTPATTTYSTRNNVVVTGDDSPVEAVSLGPRNPYYGTGSHGGFFAQPYADSGRTRDLLTVTGTTSATDGTVELSAWNPEAGSFAGTIAAAVSPSSLKVSGGPGTSATYVDGGQFTGVLDVTPFDVGSGDVLAVRAERDSDAVAPVALRAQTIARISSSSSTGRGGTVLTLSVFDQAGRPVPGAEVRRSSDDTVVGYTDSPGQVSDTVPNETMSAGYYVNTTDADPFEQGVDQATGEITTPAYVPTPTSIEPVLADGAVFDDREYAEGDIALQVLDEDGEPWSGQRELSLDYEVHPSGGAAPERETVVVDDHGRAVVDFDPAGQDGDYTLAFGFTQREEELDRSTTFTAGDAVLGLTPLAGTGTSGGQITYDGSLTVEGKPLPGRAIDLAYTPGVEQAPGTSADAALVLDGQRALGGATTTAANGTFAVTVADVVETANPAETGGTLEVTARGLGDVLDATADFAAGPAGVTPTPTPTPTTTPTPTATPGKSVIKLRLTGSDARDGSDTLRVRGPRQTAGARARIHVLTAGGFWRVLTGVDLDDKGRASLTVDDLNGEKVTRYRVRLVPNPTFKAFTSKVLRLR